METIITRGKRLTRNTNKANILYALLKNHNNRPLDVYEIERYIRERCHNLKVPHGHSARNRICELRSEYGLEIESVPPKRRGALTKYRLSESSVELAIHLLSDGGKYVVR